jgi:hypothetical protein
MREANRGQGIQSPNVKQVVEEVLGDLAKFKEQNDFSIEPATLNNKWNESLLKLGEVGLKEAKTIFISGIHQVAMTP